ncbi:hypothetical protein U91I_02753 [alpha proteobacterium U9-1i]|nr:hypothetical protein U91I_02753 [alpha proteobacterium U9-1i]
MWVLHLVFVLSAWRGEGELLSIDHYERYATAEQCRTAQMKWVMRFDEGVSAMRAAGAPEGYELMGPPLACEQASLNS